MAVPTRLRFIARCGTDQEQSISVKGEGYQTNSLVQKLNLRKNVKPPDMSFPLSTECSCLSLSASSHIAESELNNAEITCGVRFYKNFVSSSESDDNLSIDESLTFTDFLLALQRFSTQVINTYQAHNVAILTRSYRGHEQITHQHCEHIYTFLNHGCPVIKSAVLTALTKLVSEVNNVEYLFNHHSNVLDWILSLVLESSTPEVQLSALAVVEQIVFFTEFINVWKDKLEDIVLPVAQAIITNKESSEVQKLCSLRVMRNLSRHSAFTIKVKHDVLLQLTSFHNSNKVKDMCLDILQQYLEQTKQSFCNDHLIKTLLQELTSILAKGPCTSQYQALKLLITITDDRESRATLFMYPHLVVFCILCFKYSECRKVQTCVCQFLKEVIHSLTIAEAKKFMECNSESVLLEGKQSRLSHLLKRDKITNTLALTRNQANTRLWCHFDDFIDQLVIKLKKTGIMYLEVNSSALACHVGSINKDQLSVVLSLVDSFSSLCIWPLQRPGDSSGSFENLEKLVTDSSLRQQLCNLNSHHAMVIWRKVGTQMINLFRQVTKHILPSTSGQATKPDSSSTTAKSLNVDLSPVSNLATEQDLALATKHSLSPATTVAADQSLSSTVSKSTINYSDDTYNNNADFKPLTEKSDTISLEDRPHSESCLHHETIILIKSVLKFIFIMSIVSCQLEKLTDENISQAQFTNQNTKTQVLKELEEKKMSSERRRAIRNFLMKDDIFSLLAQLTDLKDDDIKTMSFTILQLLIQQVNNEAVNASSKRSETELDKYTKFCTRKNSVNMNKSGLGSKFLSYIPYNTPRSNQDMNHQNQIGRSRSASTQTLNSFVSRFSGVKLFTPLALHSEKLYIIPRSTYALLQSTVLQDSRLHTGHDRLGKISLASQNASTSLCVTTDCVNCSETELKSFTDTTTHDLHTSPLKFGNSSGNQFSESTILEFGKTALNSMFSSNMNVKQSSLQFLHDIVQQNQKKVHMELSKLGCIPKLLDFLRINDEDESLVVTGLTIIKSLVSSDHRICQLFHIHAGSNLLLSLLRNNPSEDLKADIASTLNAVTNGIRTTSNPDMSSREIHGTEDIWEHIMNRWQGEDKVVTILTQFL